MATHSSILAWRIPWRTKEPGRLQSMGLQRVGQDKRLSMHTYITKQKLTHTEKKLVVTSGEKGETQGRGVKLRNTNYFV